MSHVQVHKLDESISISGPGSRSLDINVLNDPVALKDPPQIGFTDGDLKIADKQSPGSLIVFFWRDVMKIIRKLLAIC